MASIHKTDCTACGSNQKAPTEMSCKWYQEDITERLIELEEFVKRQTCLVIIFDKNKEIDFLRELLLTAEPRQAVLKFC